MQSTYSQPRQPRAFLFALTILTQAIVGTQGQAHKFLSEAPDYEWYAGCFGTGTGNLAGFWDRHGMTNFYSGPTAGGVAPLNSYGTNGGIRSLWVSKAGVDGRPTNQFGHIDDYYSSGDGNVYDQSTAPDPYVLARRAEHTPDCIGDFIGLNQNKWVNMAGECDGNIDAYSFVFWDKTGNKRVNYSPTNATGQSIPDIQSGLKAWAKYRGYDADVFTQLPSFSPEKTGPGGFTYANMKAEIDAGYPVLLFLQPSNETSRAIGSMSRANPEIHGIMVWGYREDADQPQGIRIRTSWGSGDGYDENFSAAPLGILPGYRIRGVIGFHPKPKIVKFTRNASDLTLEWDGPSSQVVDGNTGISTTVHRYQVQMTTSLSQPKWVPVGSITTVRATTVPDVGQAFYRVSLVP